MKFTKYFMPFAALALLASCSNDKLDGPNVDAPNLSRDAATYMDVKVILPTTFGSRADGFQEFDDGLAVEYGIKNGKILLFRTSDGQCVSIGDLSVSGTPGTTSDPDVTGTVRFTRIVDNDFSSNSSYKAVVVLNVDDDQEAIKLPTVRVEATSDDGDDGTDGTTYTEWCKGEQTVTMMFEDGTTPYFTMTNALGWVGASPQVETPASYDVNITAAQHLYQDGKDDNHTVVEFYVQRGVSKVTIDNSKSIYVGMENPQTVTGSNDKIKLTGWALSYTNTKTYPVQNITVGSDQSEKNAFPTSFPTTGNWYTLSQNSPYYRFISNNLTTGGQGADHFTRVYWAIDPNYDGTAGESTLVASDFGKKELTDLTFKTGSGNNNPLYCLENTFQVQSMNTDQSTRIIFEGEYDVNGTGTPGDFIEYAGKVWRIPFKPDTDPDPDTNYAQLKSGVTASSSTHKLGDIIEDAAGEGDYVDNGKALNDAKVALGATENTVVNYYKEGKVYYTIVNRHFANTELDPTSGNTNYYYEWTMPATGYPTTDDQYLLGRYGMVRNNWYVISVNSVSGPGDPTPPTPDPDDPDDPKDPYKIDTTIYILAWAKRAHGYDLK